MLRKCVRRVRLHRWGFKYSCPKNICLTFVWDVLVYSVFFIPEENSTEVKMVPVFSSDFRIFMMIFGYNVDLYRNSHACSKDRCIFLRQKCGSVSVEKQLVTSWCGVVSFLFCDENQ